ncbi:hypothetical protein CHIBITOTORO_00430 [Serratia phage vB_SmaM-ChibiTotoro]|nr:hypothetical protein CHIBITOTORO_00430 [Serratia phage vB_SmaM-ChibiTotoro]
MGFIKAPSYAGMMDAANQHSQLALDGALPALTAFNRPSSRNAVRSCINSIIQIQLIQMMNVNIEQNRAGITSDRDYTLIAETMQAVASAFDEIFEQEPQQ